MKTFQLIVIIFVIVVLENCILIRPLLAETPADSTSLTGWRIGTSLNPLFQSENMYAIPRVYLAILPWNNRSGIEVELGYNDRNLIQSQTITSVNGSGKADTSSVLYESNTQTVRLATHIFARAKSASNLFQTIGLRGGMISTVMTKQAASVGQREYSDSKIFIEPMLGAEYMIGQHLGISMELSYTFNFDNLSGNSTRYKFTGNAYIPMTIEPIADRMNLLLNLHWYFSEQ
jgi:hypothetical protein